MKILDYKDDPTWEEVLDTLSVYGQLSKFYKLPRHEMNAIMKLCGPQAVRDLGHVFSLTQKKRVAERDEFVKSINENRLFAMLLVLGRSMKCWIESESNAPQARIRWKVAHA